MSKHKRILILAQHFDDEVLSFAGLIIKEIQKGNEVYVHVFTAGGPCSNTDVDTRINEYHHVMKFLGVTAYSYSGVDKDGRLDTIPSCELTNQIDKLIDRYQPTSVYCGPYSEHSDHQALYKAFLGSCRLRSGWMPQLLAVGTYMFTDQLYSIKDGGKILNPLSEEVYNKKCEAFKLYKSQHKPEPNPLGLEGLRIMSEYYGMLCGHKYAELYYQLRYIRD
jgi:LmbE family N-acetylglucosaminyl deacetylase